MDPGVPGYTVGSRPMPEEKTSITTQVDLKTLEGGARPALVVMTGKQLGKKYDLVKDEAIIGRSSDCEIPVKEEDISRNHARLEVEKGGKVKVIDLGSTNGTFVNKKKVKESYLDNGDQLRCGNTIFKFLSEGSVDSIYHDELYKQATLDPLTRIFNRKHFNQEIESEYSRARRYGRPLSMLMMDLDHFKKVNDTYGHPAGDYVLKQTANLVKDSLRAQDIFARFGGEEFALLLPETTNDNAFALGEKIRGRIQQAPYEYNAKKIPVTLSIGVATLKTNHANWEDLVGEADRNLYSAKNAGRNRVSR
jgi:two-component system cell cycle response regulator